MREINYSIPRTRLFFNNYLPGAVMQHRNGMYGYVMGTDTNDERTNTINRELLKEVISEQLQMWRDMGGEVDANLEAAIDNDTLAIRAPDHIFIRPSPLILECTRCHLVQQNRGRESDVISRLSGIAKGDNPDLYCPECRGRMKQVRFMRIHRCGSLEPIAPMPQHRGKRLKLIDGGTFYSTYWVDYDTNQNYGNLISTACDHCRNSNLDMRTTRGAAIRDGRSEIFYPRLSQYLSMTSETTELLEDAIAQPGGDIELGKAIICAILGLQDQSTIRNNVKSMVDGNIDKTDLGSLNANRDTYIQQRDKMKTLDGMEAMIKIAEAEIAKINAQIEQAEGLFTAADSYNFDIGLIKELATNRRSREAALFPGEFTTTTLEELRDAEPDLAERAIISENIKILKTQRAVRSIRYVKDVSVVLTSVGFSRELDNPVHNPNEIPVRLNGYIDEVSQNLAGKTPVYVLPANTEALHIRLDPVMVLRWSIDNLGWVVDDESVLDNEQRAHAFIIQAAPLLARTPAVTYSEAKHSGDTNSLNMLGLIHTLAHLLMRSAKQGSGYNENSLMEYLFPVDLSFLIYVTSTTDYTTGGLMSLFKHGLPDWFDIANLDALNCLYDPLCGQTGGSCHGCTQKAIGCETFNHGLSRAYIHGGILNYPNGQTQEIVQGLWDD